MPEKATPPRNDISIVLSLRNHCISHVFICMLHENKYLPLLEIVSKVYPKTLSSAPINLVLS